MIPMLKNSNQKVIKRMAGNALKVNRRKTITLFLAVLLSSFWYSQYSQLEILISGFRKFKISVCQELSLMQLCME